METVTSHWLAWLVFFAVAAGLIFAFVKLVLPKLKHAPATPAPAPVAVAETATEHTIAAANPAPSAAQAQAAAVDALAAKAKAAFQDASEAKALPDPWMPAGTYDNKAALFAAIGAHPEFTQNVRLSEGSVSYVLNQGGGGPGADYITLADGKVTFGKPAAYVVEPAKPDPKPAPQPVAQSLREYALTYGFPISALGDLLAYGEAHPELSPAATMKAFAEYQAQPQAPSLVIGQVAPPITNDLADALVHKFESLPDLPPTGYINMDSRYGYFYSVDLVTHNILFDALVAKGYNATTLNSKINQYATSIKAP